MWSTNEYTANASSEVFLISLKVVNSPLQTTRLKTINTGRLLGMLWFRFNRRLGQNLRQAGYTISADQLRLMVQLAENGSCNQLFLAKQLGRDRSAITRMVQAMEEKGWLERMADSSDKRAFEVRLTEAGRALHEQAERIANQTITELWSGFMTEEQDQCSDFLFRMAQNVR